MTPERWQQIEKVFQNALDLAAGEERERFLTEACADDSELRAEVEKLLIQHERAGDFISIGAIESGELPEMTEEVDNLIGKRIGAYRLLREIGRGGMGAVYEAERADNSFTRRVAVKFIKRGMDTDLILKRFRNERQILASLNHPNIARLLDGGTTADGLPYFVMEFIEGEPLYQFCDKRQFGVNARLELFRQVCGAVEEAHRNKVVHRDLKPSNILVKPDGTSKLLDFGIAKLLDPELAGATIEQTATQMRLMTPEYASPEQVCGEPVSPATDIYSLGVLLYELLTGHRPYRFKNRAMHELTRVICEQEPLAPSESVEREDNLAPLASDEKPIFGEIFTARNTTVEQLRRDLAGSLDRVILKALRKEPGERYQTVGDLLDDINRFLAKKPVKAESFVATAKPSAPQKTPVFAKSASKKSIAILPLRVLGGETTDELSEEFLGIGLADALIRRLSNLHDFIVRPTSSVFNYSRETVDPFVAGKDLDVDFVLDGSLRRAGNRIRISAQFLNVSEGATEWAENFDENFTDVLELEDTLSARVADSLVPHLNKTERQQLAKRATENIPAYEAYLKGRFYWSTFTPEGFTKALEFYQQAIKLAPDYALAFAGIADYFNFIGIYGARPFAETSAKAKEAAEKAVALDPTLAEGHASLGFATLMRDFDYEATEKHLKRAIELNPNYALGRCWYCYFLGFSARFDEAFVQIELAMEIDPFTPIIPQTLCWNLYHARRYEESIEAVRKLHEREPNYGLSHVFLSLPLICLGRYEEAVKSAEKGIALLGKSPYSLLWLASALAAAGESAKAREILKEVEQMAAAGHYVSPYLQAMVYCNLGENERAFERLEKALEIRDGRLHWLGVDPQFDSLRGKERFERILRGANNPTAKQPAKAKPRTGEKAESKSIAVLPLKVINLHKTEDSSEEFLGLGLADALTTRLSNAKKLTVRPTGSVLKFSGETVEPFDAGRELEVDFVLDGNIRRAGERLRVTVQLLDVANNSTRWAQSFDEKSSDVLELEDSISEKVANLLVPHLTGEEQKRLSKRGTNNPQAYEAYLRGRYFVNQFTPESLPKALEAFETAVALDPEYALAHTAIADFYEWANIYGILPPYFCYPRIKRAVERALEIDDQLGEAYSTLGLYYQSLLEWQKGERLYQRAIELNPNYSLAYEWYAANLIATGRTEEGLEKVRRVEELDPLSLRSMALVGWYLYQSRRFEESLEKARQIVELDPNYPQAFVQTGNSLVELGRADEAIAPLKKAIELIPGSGIPMYILCFAYSALGQTEKARDVLREMDKLGGKGYFNPYFRAMAHAAIGETDEALNYFEKAVQQSSPWVTWLGTDPKLDDLRGNPRFQQLFARTNNPLAIRQAAQFAAQPEKKSGGQSLAVLPLKFIGTRQPEDAYLGIGLADTMITRLSNVGRLIVRPTSAVLPFAETTDSFAAGRNLDVDFVLDGTIRRAGARVRISAQLLDVKTSSTRWAESFDENLTDVLDLEDRVAEKVARMLVPRLTGEEKQKLAKRGTDNADAYEAYLRGRYHLSLFTPDNFAQAKSYFEEAIQFDPNYALAYIGMAECYFCLGTFAAGSPLECYRLSREMAEKALALDASLGEAYTILGFVKFSQEYDFKTADELLRRGIELNPGNSLGRVWYSVSLTAQKKFEEAIEEAARAVELDPISPFARQHHAWILYHSRRFDEAIARSSKTVETDSYFSHARGVHGWMLRHLNNLDESIRHAEAAVELSNANPWLVGNLAASYAEAGQRKRAMELLRGVETASGERYVSSYVMAIAYYFLGETDKVFARLEDAYAARDVWLIWLGVEPQFDPLREDSRFKDLLRRINSPSVK